MSTEDDADFHCERAEYLFYVEDRRAREAVSHVQAALDIEPRHQDALILAGEIYTLGADELGLDPDDADRAALDYFDRAIACQPKNPEAWAGKGLALLYLKRPAEALEAAEMGLMVLPLNWGSYMSCPDVHVNVAESLFRVKVQALLDLGRRDEARQALSAGFEYCPGSAYLSLGIEDVTPFALRPNQDEG